MNRMMAIDEAGGLGKAGVEGVVHRSESAAKVQRTVVAALCTPDNPLGKAPARAAAKAD